MSIAPFGKDAPRFGLVSAARGPQIPPVEEESHPRTSRNESLTVLHPHEFSQSPADSPTGLPRCQKNGSDCTQQQLPSPPPPPPPPSKRRLRGEGPPSQRRRKASFTAATAAAEAEVEVVGKGGERERGASATFLPYEAGGGGIQRRERGGAERGKGTPLLLRLFPPPPPTTSSSTFLLLSPPSVPSPFLHSLPPTYTHLPPPLPPPGPIYPPSLRTYSGELVSLILARTLSANTRGKKYCYFWVQKRCAGKLRLPNLTRDIHHTKVVKFVYWFQLFHTKSQDIYAPRSLYPMC